MTVHPRLSLNAVSSVGWTFDEDLALWDELGVHHVGLQGRKLVDDVERKVEALQARGLRSATVIAPSFELDRPDTWDATRRGIATAVDIAVATGGTSTYLPTGRTTGAPWDDVLELFAAAVEPAVADAHSRGVRLSIEPTLGSQYSFVNTLRDAIVVAERAGVGIVMDFGTCWMERDLRGALQEAAPHLGLVQLCDVEIGVPDRPGRGRVPVGEGELPMRRIMEEILDAGYDGLFDMELIGPAVEDEGYASMIPRAMEKASALLADVGL